MTIHVDSFIDPVPENFASSEEAADFWDTHSLADYWDQTQEVEIEVRAARRQWIPLAANLSEKAVVLARKEACVSVETLINLLKRKKSASILRQAQDKFCEIYGLFFCPIMSIADV